MIKEAIEKILSLDSIKTYENGGRVYVKRGQGVERLKTPDQIAPVPLAFNSLTGLCEYIKQCPERFETPVNWFLFVADFNRVDLCGPLQGDNDNIRFEYAFAKTDDCSFRFGAYLEIEDFIINLRNSFTTGADDDMEKVVNYAANIKSVHDRKYKDDGLTQTISIKTGLTTASEVQIENPVRLYPWRTFREVDQPANDCILRFKESARDQAPTAALFESWGRLWRIDAIAGIHRFLIDKLGSEVRDGLKILS